MNGLSFSEPMVRAWLEGRKDVTRRIVKLPPDFLPTYACSAKMEDPPVWFDFVDDDGKLRRLKPRYRPGQTVYIKEAWAITDLFAAPITSDFDEPLWAFKGRPDPEYKSRVIYYADHPGKWKGAWRSPRFMPEWASRSHARIVSVRPERVQAITEEEAIREGVEPFTLHGRRDYEEGFVLLWEKIHGHESWERNDWVWRIELEKLTP